MNTSEDKKCEHNQVTIIKAVKWEGEKRYWGDKKGYTFKINELYSEEEATCDDCGEKLKVMIDSY